MVPYVDNTPAQPKSLVLHLLILVTSFAAVQKARDNITPREYSVWCLGRISDVRMADFLIARLGFCALLCARSVVYAGAQLS